jgi:hypothetical protein
MPIDLVPLQERVASVRTVKGATSVLVLGIADEITTAVDNNEVGALVEKLKASHEDFADAVAELTTLTKKPNPAPKPAAPAPVAPAPTPAPAAPKA